MNLTTLIGGGAIAGLIAGFWEPIKGYLMKVVSLLIVTVDLDNRECSNAVSVWVLNNCKPSPFRGWRIQMQNEYVQPVMRNQFVGFRCVPNLNTLWIWNRAPIWTTMSVYDGSKLTFIRGTLNPDKMIREIVDTYNKKRTAVEENEQQRFFVKRLTGSIGSKMVLSKTGNDDDDEISEGSSGGRHSSSDATKLNSTPIQWTSNQLGFPVKCGSVDDMSLTDEIYSFYKDVIKWKDSERWFKERKIPWKLSCMLSGAPGTGKTAFTRAIGQELDLPIFSFDLASMTNSDFIEAWSGVTTSIPCIVLFEDIDGVFDHRKNVSCEGSVSVGLSFDCFLNVIDGVENTDGILKIVTTNDMSKVDPALGVIYDGHVASRPGRIDRIIQFLPLDSAGRMKMANRIFHGVNPLKWEHLLEEGKRDTGAQFQERCCRLALALYWEKETRE